MIVSRQLSVITFFILATLISASTYAQNHSQESVQQFGKQFQGILQKGLKHFEENESLLDIGGGGFSNGRTNISANQKFIFRAPEGDTSLTYDISIGRYDSEELGLGGANALQRTLSADVAPTQQIQVLKKLPGEGSLRIGDKSYYAGVHSASNTRTAYQNYRHTAFALRGEWLVKVEVSTYKPAWNDTIKAQQKDILIRLVNAIGGSAVKKMVDTQPREEQLECPNLAGRYQVEDNVWALQQDGERIFGTYQIGNVTVTIDTKYTHFTKQNALGETETFEAFQGTYKAQDTDGGKKDGDIRISETDVPGVLTLTTYYFTNDGEFKSQSVTLNKR